MPKVNEDYERKSAHLGLRLTEQNKCLVDSAVTKSNKGSYQNALEPVIIAWAKRILRNKGE